MWASSKHHPIQDDKVLKSSFEINLKTKPIKSRKSSNFYLTSWLVKKAEISKKSAKRKDIVDELLSLLSHTLIFDFKRGRLLKLRFCFLSEELPKESFALKGRKSPKCIWLQQVEELKISTNLEVHFMNRTEGFLFRKHSQAQQVSISENKVSRNFENPILLKITEIIP